MKMHELNTSEPYSGEWSKIDHALRSIGFASGREAINSWNVWDLDVSKIWEMIEEESKAV